MASNDIISTNVPSKVPTTDTEEYPVQQPYPLIWLPYPLVGLTLPIFVVLPSVLVVLPAPIQNILSFGSCYPPRYIGPSSILVVVTLPLLSVTRHILYLTFPTISYFGNLVFHVHFFLFVQHYILFTLSCILLCFFPPTIPASCISLSHFLLR